MSRPIVFRAWDKACKIMLESVTIYAENDHIGIPYEGDDNNYYTDEQVDKMQGGHLGSAGEDWLYILNEFEVMQFTGVTDLKNIDIYEGDLIQYSNQEIKQVVFLEGSFGVITKYNDGYGSSFGSAHTWRQGIVIGNIFENPELF
jgi:hypothetical protein